MTLHQMLEMLDRQPAIEKVGVVFDTSPAVVLKHVTSGLVTQVPISALENIDEQTLLAILTGEREPRALRYMSRIVGYMSHLEAWNASKIGELRDRHKGNYVVDDVQSDGPRATAQAVLSNLSS